MKKRNNDTLLVELKDLNYLGSLPSEVVIELKDFYDVDEWYAEFSTEESKKYFDSKDEIIDYDEVSLLSDYEIDNKINEYYIQLENISTRNYDNNQFNRRKLEYKISTLSNYKRNRSKYDELFKPSSKSNKIVLE